MGVICYLLVDSVKNKPIDWVRVLLLDLTGNYA